MFKTKRQKNVTIGLFAIYILFLVWLILFKFQTHFRELEHIRNINLIPFSASMIVNGKINLREIIYNVFVFIPMGIYINLFKPKWSFIQKATLCLGISLLFEILQFVLAIGASDITDIIGNTLGGIIGIGIYGLLKKIFKDKVVPLVNVTAMIVSVLATLMLSILIFSNM